MKVSMDKVKAISPKDAWALLQSAPRAILIDVRSDMEFLFVGHPKGAIHLAWIDYPEWVINPTFVTETRKTLLGGASTASDHANAPILLICRSGKRSKEAGNLLIDNGFTAVYSIEGGFEGELDGSHHRGNINGWRYAKLPWEQC